VSHSVGKEWNEKLLENEYSTSFQTKEWCELYEKSFGSKPIFILVKDSNGNIVGQLAALIHKRYNWRDSNFSKFVVTKLNLGLSLEWERGPIIHDDNLSKEIVTKIFSSMDKIAIENNVSMMRGTSPTNSNLSKFPFDNIHFEKKSWSTYITKLDNKEDLYNNLDKKTRYDIRKSEKTNFEFVIVKEKSDFLDYVRLKLKSKNQGEHGIERYPDFFEQHWKSLHSTGLEQLFLAKMDGETISGILCSTFNGNMIQHGVVTSSIPISGTFLTWKTIFWGIDNGYRYYDMGGANPSPMDDKEKGINFFKSKWNGKKDDYVILTKVINKSNYRISRMLQNPKKISKKIKEKFD